MARFDTATSVDPLGPGRYSADLDPGYLVGQAMNGGYLMAVLQRAALRESSHPHAVASSFHFLRPGAAGAAEIEASVLKSGRTVTTVQVDIGQGGRPVVTGTIATAALDPDATPAYEAPSASVPPIDRCPRYEPRPRRAGGSPFPERIDQYLAPETWERLRHGGSDGGEGRVPDLCGHVRLSEADGGLGDDPCLVLPLAVDAPPSVITVFGTRSWAPTVELTWHMRAIPAPGPLAFRSRAHAVVDGWFDETLDLWDVKGRLVAQSRQLARRGR
ncbi:thioesterase family protein [Nocardiopsis rhodophaea]|uniref:Thioesterase family protein n=1 Tax=Nocardiopsis rhodophaea TaxID=280238 RepID=A0ABP5F4T6_9ACTN